MSVQVEKLEKSMVKLTITVSAEDFEAALNRAYLSNKNKISVPGFRRGKASRTIIEKIYGAEIFYQDAADIMLPDAYEKAADESGLVIVAQPEIGIEQMEKGKDFIFTATVAVKPEVILGEYKGIEVEKRDTEVSEEEVAEEIEHIRDINSRLLTVDDRPAQDGDVVIIDFDGYVDGEQFEGGYATDYSLQLGSNTFIDNFEEQLVGTNVGDRVEVNVKFPDSYQDESLQGKPALFEVKIKEIQMKELPELDDDFAQDVSDCETMEEYREDVKRRLEETKEEEAESEKEIEVVSKIVENAEMEIPEQMIEAQTRQMSQEFAQRLQAQGLSLNQYLAVTGTTQQDVLEELKPQALKRIQSRLVLEAIATAENIVSSEEEIDQEIENMASEYQLELDEFKEMIDDEEREQIGVDIAVQKAVDLVVEAAVEK